MRTITINATAAAVGALVLAGGTFAAGYITSNNAAPTKAASSQPVAQAAPQRATNVSSQRVARTGELVPQSLKASAASTLKVGSKVYSLWLNPAEFHPIGDPRACALANDGSYVYRNVGHVHDLHCASAAAGRRCARQLLAGWASTTTRRRS